MILLYFQQYSKPLRGPEGQVTPLLWVKAPAYWAAR